MTLGWKEFLRCKQTKCNQKKKKAFFIVSSFEVFREWMDRSSCVKNVKRCFRSFIVPFSYTQTNTLFPFLSFYPSLSLSLSFFLFFSLSLSLEHTHTFRCTQPKRIRVYLHHQFRWIGFFDSKIHDSAYFLSDDLRVRRDTTMNRKRWKKLLR